LLQKLLPADHALVAGGLLRYADTLRSARRLDEAEAALDQAAMIVREGSPEQAQLAMFRGQLANARGRPAEAAGHFHAAFVAFRTIAGEKSPMTWGARGEQGRMLLLARDLDAAAPVVEETFEMRRRHMAPDSLDVVLSEHSMGTLRAAQGRVDEALEYWARAIAGYERIYGATHARALGMRSTVVEFLASRADPGSRARARVEVDQLIALHDGVEARALSAYIAARAGDSARAAEDLARGRMLAAAADAGPIAAREQAWLERGTPITIDAP
jgi:tetratricopeptide (TPR) repeat protein